MLINNEWRLESRVSKRCCVVAATGWGRLLGFKKEKEGLRRVRDTCKEENEEGPTLTSRRSAMARPSVFSGNNRKRNICARNATRSPPLSLSSPSSSSLLRPSHTLFPLHFILRSLLPVHPPRRRLVSVLPSLPLYWDVKRERCRSLNLFSVGVT